MTRDGGQRKENIRPSLNLLIITLNINSLNIQVKDRDWHSWIWKSALPECMLSKRNLLEYYMGKLKVAVSEKIHHANTNQMSKLV